jgi:cytochrome c peroxidase
MMNANALWPGGRTSIELEREGTTRMRIDLGKRTCLAFCLAAAAAACGGDDERNPATGGTGAQGGAPVGGGSAGPPPGGAGSDGNAGGSSPSSGGNAGGGGSGAGGGAGAAAEVTFTAAELAAFAEHSPLPDVPADPTNAVADDPAARLLGQKLFFDKAYSGALRVDSDLGATGETGKISCATCHTSEYMDDQRSLPSTVSLGADFHTRNAPTVINSSYYVWTNWGGRFSAQWELPMPVSESGVIMNSNRLRVVHRIFEAYRTEYEAIFGPMEPAIGTDPMRFPADAKPKPAPTPEVPDPPDGAWEAMAAEDRAIVNRIFVNFGKLLQAYIRTLVSKNAPFDRFVAGEEDALTEAQKRGAKIFVGKGQCSGCHSGSHFSDDDFHNLGVPQTGDNVPASDDGRFKDVPPLLASAFNSDGAFSDDTTTGRLDGLTDPMPESARGAFRTPSLRGTALTGPYMHSGQLATLADVVEFYDQGGGSPVSGTLDPLMVPLGLTEQEKADLVAFLEALTGDPIPAALLEDTSAN